MKLLDYALSFIAPHRCYKCNTEGTVCCQKCLEEIADPSSGRICYICSEPTTRGVGICKKCKPTQNLDSVLWYADYDNPLASKLVKSLKFNHTFAARSPLAKGVSAALRTTDADLLTAVPTANKRIRGRGWDQAKLIAKASSKQNKLPYKSLLLRTSSFDQIGASKHQRAEASKRFFKPIRKALIKNKVIILIDDVITTGSTLDSAAKTLKSAGAKEVHAITFARQGLRSRS